MYLVQILLPLFDNEGRAFSPALMAGIEDELTGEFGGLTAYGRVPAEGVWAHGGKRTYDDIAVVEVMVTSLDAQWWCAFRERIETILSQEKLVIRALHTTML